MYPRSWYLWPLHTQNVFVYTCICSVIYSFVHSTEYLHPEWCLVLGGICTDFRFYWIKNEVVTNHFTWPSTVPTDMTTEISMGTESRYSPVYLFCFNFGHCVNQIDNQEIPVCVQWVTKNVQHMFVMKQTPNLTIHRYYTKKYKSPGN